MEQKSTLCLVRKGTLKFGCFLPCLGFEMQETVDLEWLFDFLGLFGVLFVLF